MQSKIFILVLLIAAALCYVSNVDEIPRCCTTDAPIICGDLNLSDNCESSPRCVVDLGRLIMIPGTCTP
ncbi:hypothetical protein DdX_19681 [Ditylenchus destructor]|uniref:Uncharacterized protein n=1 Tax=Ditylenchus destructor TaxID=166010 RepID=A0AAD4MI02_9BILA|nr:hypothetical protein DdX_19681 [Ditylenchus destructor]